MVQELYYSNNYLQCLLYVRHCTECFKYVVTLFNPWKLRYRESNLFKVRQLAKGEVGFEPPLPYTGVLASVAYPNMFYKILFVY